MSSHITSEQIELLRRIDTPTICNAVEKLGIRPPTEGHMGTEVRCLLPDLGVMVGLAVTARFGSTDRAAKHSMAPYWQMWDALDASAKPGVLVTEEIGPDPGRGCILGDGMATVATRLGGIGVVSNSGVRDIAGIRALSFHVFGLGLAPSHGNFGVVEAGTPVTVSGVRVAPGDIVHGDANGVTVFPASVTADVIRLAHEIIAYEAEVFGFFRAPDFSLAGLKKRLGA